MLEGSAPGSFIEDGSIIFPEDGIVVNTVSCDEKPEIQAIAMTGDDLCSTTDTGLSTVTQN